MYWSKLLHITFIPNRHFTIKVIIIRIKLQRNSSEHFVGASDLRGPSLHTTPCNRQVPHVRFGNSATQIKYKIKLVTV